jgi:hypothetical protein
MVRASGRDRFGEGGFGRVALPVNSLDKSPWHLQPCKRRWTLGAHRLELQGLQLTPLSYPGDGRRRQRPALFGRGDDVEKEATVGPDGRPGGHSSGAGASARPKDSMLLQRPEQPHGRQRRVEVGLRPDRRRLPRHWRTGELASLSTTKRCLARGCCARRVRQAQATRWRTRLQARLVRQSRLHGHAPAALKARGHWSCRPRGSRSTPASTGRGP